MVEPAEAKREAIDLREQVRVCVRRAKRHQVDVHARVYDSVCVCVCAWACVCVGTCVCAYGGAGGIVEFTADTMQQETRRKSTRGRGREVMA